jgi:hypothetical protein
VHTWRLEHWYTNMWEVGSATPANDTTQLLLPFFRGGFQGAEGTQAGGEWYIEGVLAELDAPFEYHYDAATGSLYFLPNTTEYATTGIGNAGGDGRLTREAARSVAAAAGSTFVATQVSVLFQLAGNQTHPVCDIVIANLTLRDAAATFMEPHGMPSGGDWTLQHSGAVTATRAESLDIKWVDFVPTTATACS